MSIFKPEYATYQDVKDTLAWWSMPLFFLAELLVYRSTLTPSHRAALLEWFPELQQWVAGTGKLMVAATLAGVLSHFCVHLLEVHDHWYDRYLVGWRRRYDHTFIIPRLLQPYQQNSSPSIVDVARAHSREFMRNLFYAFVRDRDAKIPVNLVVRFYERITKYWLTQIAEVVCLLTIAVSVAYWLTGRVACWSEVTFPTSTIAAAALGWAISRGAALSLRRDVEEATEEEIQAIHEKCRQEFERALEEFSRVHGVSLTRT